MAGIAFVRGHNRSVCLNANGALFRELNAIIAARNLALLRQPGKPQVEIATTTRQLWAVAELFATTFVRCYDRSWVAWLPPRELHQIAAGDFAGADHKLTRIIHYLMSTALMSGGIIAIETAADETSGERLVRGAVLRKLPPAIKKTESVLRRYLLGGFLALQSYGVRRAVAAARAARELDEATEVLMAQHGIPDRCVRGGMLAVRPQYQGLGVSSRLCAPFHELADCNGLWIAIQSSRPEYNDDRAFRSWGFERIGRHHYGPSPCNGVGPYALNVLARKPEIMEKNG
jgi:GNAT superfamily N-acetyltransferase